MRLEAGGVGSEVWRSWLVIGDGGWRHKSVNWFDSIILPKSNLSYAINYQ